jgi:hypothetical protein
LSQPRRPSARRAVWTIIPVKQHGTNHLRVVGPMVSGATEVHEAFVVNVMENALTAITTAGDGGVFAEEYAAAGGGYEGLQAIADKALALVKERRCSG